jgi:signal transduction histidine kinase
MTNVALSSPDTRPPWLERISPAQWVAVDVFLAAFFALGTLAHLFFFPRFANANPAQYSRWLLAPLYLLATVPLAFRRRWPGRTLALTCSAIALTTMLGHPLAPAPLLALPLYTVTMTSSRRRSLQALVMVGLAMLIAVLVGALLGHVQGDVTFNIFLAIATWFVADSIRTRRIYLRGLAEQKEERQRLEIEGARRAIIEERMAIARELHDVVAHSLSVIAIQSGVGRHVIDTQPDEARKALLAVEETSRSALEELRGVLGVLRRSGDDTAQRSPAPILGDLDELVERIRSTGVPVELTIEGSPRPLPQGLELSVYRIIQEALTNVVKHTNSAPTSITITYGNDELDVRVRNGGSPRSGDADTWVEASGAQAGHGIIGMTERARSFGGSLLAQPLIDGGYLVSAHLRTRDAS